MVIGEAIIGDICKTSLYYGNYFDKYKKIITYTGTNTVKRMSVEDAERIGNPIASREAGSTYFALRLSNIKKYDKPILMTNLFKENGERLTITPQKYTFVNKYKKGE
jgi:hypothetical protein